MNPSAALDALKAVRNCEAEERFFASLATRTDPRLVRWAENYHYFSVHQARLLALVVGTLMPSDAESLTEVTKALYEEFGSGDASRVHSRLFLQFCDAARVDTSHLPLPRTRVLLPVVDYLREIETAYRSGEIASILGAYAFLERSAVLSYPVMLTAFKRLSFAADELDFFTTHVEQEIHHQTGAFNLVVRLVGDAEAETFVAQLKVMEHRWGLLWRAFE